MIFHENRLPAEDSHEISCLICYFRKGGKILNCRLLQIIGDASWVEALHQVPGEFFMLYLASVFFFKINFFFIFSFRNTISVKYFASLPKSWDRLTI